MRDRLRGFLRFLFRLVLIGLGLGALFLGWQALLRYGPGGAGSPAMYLFHAKALVRQRGSFPRPATVFLPAPSSMSSADVQLRLMKWWDGKRWLPEALAHGEAVKGGLRLRAGALELMEVMAVTPAEAEEGVVTCAVRVKVTWAFPENLQELLRVKEIVALRFPKGLAPGQTTEIPCRFRRPGWRWELVSAESPWGGKLPVVPENPSPLDWLF